MRLELPPHIWERIMTNEEMQRTMEFIVEQQAQFATNFQRAEEERIRDQPRLARLEESFQRLVELCQIIDARLDTTDERLDRLESHESALEENMSRLAAAQAHADERLSALIDIVREDRNGKSQPS
jgi:chromosome segregation ATPase